MNAIRSKFTIAGVAVRAIVCVTVFALIAIGYYNLPRNTPSGQLIEQYGTFRSPHGNGIVTFNSVGTKQGTVTVSANSPTRSPSSTIYFVPAQTWFGAWDDKDRFWTYIEGVGVHIHDEANGISCTTHIDEFGDGRSIPPEFLRRLREAEIRKDKHSTKPPDSKTTAP